MKQSLSSGVILSFIYFNFTLLYNPSLISYNLNHTYTMKTFAEFCQENGVTAVHGAVRVNTNNYPFITVLRGNDAENIYFSKNASNEVSEGSDVTSIAKQLFVTETVNAAGESRTKLSFNKGNYIDIADLF